MHHHAIGFLVFIIVMWLFTSSPVEVASVLGHAISAFRTAAGW
jgi:hypothetical protein